MKKMQCVNVDPLYERWGYKKGEVYDVDDSCPLHPDHYSIFISRYRGGTQTALWFPRRDFIELPDVPTCAKCGLTDPPSDEDTITEPCANNAHEWLDDR